MHWWHIGLDVGVGTFNVEKGKKAKWQTEWKNKNKKKKMESVKHGGKFLMVQSSSNMEKEKVANGQKISGKVSNTVENDLVQNIWFEENGDRKSVV